MAHLPPRVRHCPVRRVARAVLTIIYDGARAMPQPTPSGPPSPSPAPAAGVTAPGDPLRGKVAVITGASSGLGEAIATALVTRGVHVALSARRAAHLDALARRLADIPGAGATLLVPGDVRDQA